MKPANSVARRWEFAARIARWGSLLLSIAGVVFLALAIVQRTATRPNDSRWRSSSGHTSAALPASRPALVEQIAARSLRQPLIARLEPVAQGVEASPASAPSASPVAPAVEIVATYMGADAPPRAFVRRGDASNLLVWSAGSVEGAYTVTEIGDGWVALESGQARHTLRVPRRLP